MLNKILYKDEDNIFMLLHKSKINGGNIYSTDLRVDDTFNDLFNKIVKVAIKLYRKFERVKFSYCVKEDDIYIIIEYIKIYEKTIIIINFFDYNFNIIPIANYEFIKIK